ncbi:hypothetical protein AB0J35_30795 [Nonomuraea angiospora]|uniref:hypothetical protein n=1 Tax=Nonomuraea angiospora TaxID=46172 RepID=UPI00343EE1DB
MYRTRLIALDGGRARWYGNRYLRTPLYEHPGQSRFALAFDQETGRIDYRVTTANTRTLAGCSPWKRAASPTR